MSHTCVLTETAAGHRGARDGGDDSGASGGGNGHGRGDGDVVGGFGGLSVCGAGNGGGNVGVGVGGSGSVGASGAGCGAAGLGGSSVFSGGSGGMSDSRAESSRAGGRGAASSGPSRGPCLLVFGGVTIHDSVLGLTLGDEVRRVGFSSPPYAWHAHTRTPRSVRHPPLPPAVLVIQPVEKSLAEL